MAEVCTVSLLLRLNEDHDPAEVTALVGIQPTRVTPGRHASRVWEVLVEGRSPVGAARLANDLARDLAGRIGADRRSRKTWALNHDPEVRFRFSFDHLLNFSYAVEPDVVGALADLHCSITFLHDEARCPTTPYRFGRDASPDEGCQASLRLSGPELDSSAVTSGLGVQPSETGMSFWVLDGARLPFRTADAAIVDLLGQLPRSSPAWAGLTRDHDARVLLAFRVRTLTGGFDLRTSTMRQLAARGLGLDVSLYNWGPTGADLLG